MPELVISDLRGGMNDADPPIALAEDQCVLARNVEFYQSMLGDRRLGGVGIDLSGSPFATCDKIVWGHRHLPTRNPSDAQLWLLGLTGAVATLGYKDTTWHTVTMADALTVDGASEYQVRGVTLHGKLFLAYNSAVDYLHVWDGTSLRRVGLIQPSAAPTGAETGTGTFSTARYYRTRETVQASGVTVLRSEPSETVTVTPTGTASGVVVTKPATTNANATHWEAEASLDNSNFYVIATVAIGTTTTTDTTAAATGYSAFELSEDIGDYEVPHSARILIADEDRLVMMGSFEDEALDSVVKWTPVFNATGVGNDERVTLDPVSLVNLDGSEGGSITDAGRWAAGEMVVGKESHVYKGIRTGNRQRAYDFFNESKEIGVIYGSMVEGVDESGSAALYFLEPSVGPYRFSMRTGLQYCGRDISTTWDGANLDAAVIARGLFFRKKKQIRWVVATGDSETPDFGIWIQTNAMRTTEGGEARRGFSVHSGPSCGALTMFLFSDNIDDDTDRSRRLVPFVGLEGNGLVLQMESGDDDNGTEYAARLTTKPYAPTNLLTQFEVKGAMLVAKAVEDSRLVLSAIPNGGTSTTQIAEAIDCTPDGDETFVVRQKDDLEIAELTTVQIDVADVATPGTRWELARVSLTWTHGQGN